MQSLSEGAYSDFIHLVVTVLYEYYKNNIFQIFSKFGGPASHPLSFSPTQRFSLTFTEMPLFLFTLGFPTF